MKFNCPPITYPHSFVRRLLLLANHVRIISQHAEVTIMINLTAKLVGKNYQHWVWKFFRKRLAYTHIRKQPEKILYARVKVCTRDGTHERYITVRQRRRNQRQSLLCVCFLCAVPLNKILNVLCVRDTLIINNGRAHDAFIPVRMHRPAATYCQKFAARIINKRTERDGRRKDEEEEDENYLRAFYSKISLLFALVKYGMIFFTTMLRTNWMSYKKSMRHNLNF